MVCTDFCESLKSIDVKDHDALPSHDTLVTLLNIGSVEKDQGRSLGTLQQIRQRSNVCAFCQLVTTAIQHSIRSGDLEAADPGQPIHVLLFPGEQSFRLSFPSRLGLRLSFVADDLELVNAPDAARVINPVGIEVAKIKDWLKVCEKGHETCSLESIEDAKITAEQRTRIQQHAGHFEESATSNFRVLDLEAGCIKQVILDTRYVTLSYVWGQVPTFSLQKDNFELMSTPGSLNSIRKDLPKTLNDAINLVKQLGERYIWIDGLCLVQDDEIDVCIGVEMMNSIYHGSLFTIIAGSGTDADAGLPGLGENPRNAGPGQVVAEITPRLRMTFSNSIDWHLSRSWYNHRGWTLQELVLSRRTAIFINGQVYFRCREANWSEELWSDKFVQYLDPDDSNIMRLPDPSDGFMPSCWAYQKVCEEYSRRTIRRDGDAIRALAGLIRPLAAGMETELVDGVPGYYVDHFLLFISSEGKMCRRPEFASFSWAGWEGSIMFPRENFVWFDQDNNRTWDTANILRYLKYHSLVQWSYFDQSASSEHLTSLYHDEPSPLIEMLKEHPKVFPNIKRSAEQDILDVTWCRGASWNMNTPHWYRSHAAKSNQTKPFSGILKSDDGDKEDDLDSRDIKKKLGPRSAFSIKGLDLANGQAEFSRLIKKIDNVYERSALYNWMAQRYFRSKSAELKGTFGPRFRRPNNGEGSNYTFRNPYGEEERAQRSVDKGKDKRTNSTNVRERERYFPAEKKATNRDGGDLEIPLFPPYTVLHFVTVSLKLVLDRSQRAQERRQRQQEQDKSSPFYRIPGIPLLSDTSKIVGSLHPDNEEETLSLPEETKIELIVISRSNTPTIGSALLHLPPPASTPLLSSSSTSEPSDQEINIKNHHAESDDNIDPEGRWKLLWVLHVIERDGVHERRGVGQIQQSALEEEFESKPALKSIFLG